MKNGGGHFAPEWSVNFERNIHVQKNHPIGVVKFMKYLFYSTVIKNQLIYYYFDN